MRRAWPSRVLFLGVVVALLLSLSWLIQTRFETGDAYPRGSSFRADPLGAKALFESYAALPGVEVERNFKPFDQMAHLDAGATLFLLNVNGRNLHGLARSSAVERFVSGGGRLVLALNADNVAYRYASLRIDNVEADEENEAGEDAETADEADGEGSFKRRPPGSDNHFWAGLSLQHGKHRGGEARLAEGLVSPRLPDALPWREGGVLVDMDEAWRPLYRIGEEVVMAERALGRGSIVVATDDYLFTNEALFKNRYSSFLLWSAGGADRILFDETHLGVAERTGIATLVRRYRLSGFAVALAALMLLVIWRGGSPLVPPYSGRITGNFVRVDQSTEAGLADLLRRSLPAKELPAEAFRMWKQSCVRTAADEAYYAAEIRAAEALLQDRNGSSKRKTNPGQIHSEIQTIINQKKRKSL